MRKHGPRIVGFGMLAMSVMALTAVSASAETGSHWNINGAALNNNILLPAPEGTLENNHGALLSRVLNKPLTVLCTSLEFQEFVLKAEGSSLGKFRFSGCKVLIDGVVMPACEPRDGVESGVILTNLLKDLIILHEGPEMYDRLEPEVGNVLATILMTNECSIGESLPVIGKFVAKDCNLEGRVEKVTHLAEEGPLTEMWVISKTVEHIARIDGSTNVFLSAPHQLPWSGTPA